MNESIEKLKKKFLEIKRMGYVESTRSGPQELVRHLKTYLEKMKTVVAIQIFMELK